MKLTRLLVFAALAAFLPLVASAQDGVVFTDNDGIFTYNQSTSVLDLGVSIYDGTGHQYPGTLTAISGLSAFGIPDNAVSWNPLTDTCTPACLGSLTLQTSTLQTGTVGTNSGSATFNPGGFFRAAYTDGVVFKGSFSSASWTLIGPDTWTFSGIIMDGTLKIPLAGGGFLTFNNINGATVQLTTFGAAGVEHKNKNEITFKDSGGTSNFSVAPEPGTLTLFGSGLIAVGMFTRRRLAARSASSQSSSS